MIISNYYLWIYRIIYLTVDLEETHIIDRETNVYICDSLDILSARLPPELIAFLGMRFTSTCVTISNKLSTTCEYYIFSFVLFMSKY